MDIPHFVKLKCVSVRRLYKKGRVGGQMLKDDKEGEGVSQKNDKRDWPTT